MCIFSGPVVGVANTQIFAKKAKDERQFLVYCMQYQAESALAMILPLPTPVSPDEDAIRFIDLSGYPDFFKDMAKGFPEILTFSEPMPRAVGPSNLRVHEVGSFEASFVPRLQDFSRLDTRFRLPEQTWDQLPTYKDYAFAVFKLKPGAKEIHPMAFEFPRRDPEQLFFPTTHIHDGTVEKVATFDHELYCQISDEEKRWGRRSADERERPLKAQDFMECDKTQGMVDPNKVIQMRQIYGTYHNRDIFITDN